MKWKISLSALILILSASQGQAMLSKIGTAFDETLIQSPFVESNEESLQSESCRGRPPYFKWDYCAITNDKGEEQVSRFSFTNWGDNEIVHKGGFGVGRDFQFLFQGYARSDLGLLVWDVPDETTSHWHMKLMMFFPREVLPAIRFKDETKKDFLIVTLPTREEVLFDSASKVIKGGVLGESPIKVNSAGVALNPGVKYSGEGVVMEADRLNDYPVGVNFFSKNNLATISKKGQKDCKIPARELWYTDESKGGNIFFNKKYVTDAAFDEFLKKRCKFSMYNTTKHDN